jgi:hypothetical protein
MAAKTTAALPHAWSQILEQIEVALSQSLNQVAVPEKSGSFANSAPSLAVPELDSASPRALGTAEASATASEAELARAEQMLRDWLASVRASRRRLEDSCPTRVR